MNSTVEPFEWQEVETEVVEEGMPSLITTTLYDLMAAMHAMVEPDKDVRVVATVAHLLRSGRITLLRHRNL